MPLVDQADMVLNQIRIVDVNRETRQQLEQQNKDLLSSKEAIEESE